VLFYLGLLSVIPLLLAPAAAAANAQLREAFALNERGLEAAARRDYAVAEKDHRASVQLYRALGASYEAHLSIALFNLAETVCGEGGWKEAAAIFRESLELSRRALGPKHIRSVASLNALGHVEMVLGDFDSAAAHFAEALSVARELYPRDIHLAYALAGVSSLRLMAGVPEDALPFAEEALRVAIDAELTPGVDTALMYQNVGRIHRAAGRSERALPLLRKARAIYERVGATADPRYAAAFSEEGLALMHEGQYVQAGGEMKRAIGLLEQCAGCGFELAIARSNLGLLRFRQKKYVEADDLLRKALADEELYIPADAVQIGETRKTLQQVRSALR
jgi:tetratricopeptide (TPR) repeat protein